MQNFSVLDPSKKIEIGSMMTHLDAREYRATINNIHNLGYHRKQAGLLQIYTSHSNIKVLPP